MKQGPSALEVLGDMHGIPFSIKDNIQLKGKLTTVGCAFLCAEEFRDDTNAVVVQLMLRAGAIPLVKGNVPQSAINTLATNLVFGEMRHPLDQNRSTGGSSGGDAGLILSRCIPCSLGTDGGASIRIPAAFCGIYALKPSTNRVSNKGHV